MTRTLQHFPRHLRRPPSRPPRAPLASPPLQRPGPLRGRPARGPRGLPTAPERWRRLGPAQLQGSKSTPPAACRAQLLPRSAPTGASGSSGPHALSRPLAPSPCRTSARRRRRSVPARGDGLCRRLFSRPGPTGARAPLSRSGSGDARPPVAPSALCFLVPPSARSPAPRSLRAPLRGRPAGPRNPLRAAGRGGALGRACAARSRCSPTLCPGSPHMLLCLGGGDHRSRARAAVVVAIGLPSAARPPPSRQELGPRSRSSSSQAEGRSP